jgi:hypothetical protein
VGELPRHDPAAVYHDLSSCQLTYRFVLDFSFECVQFEHLPEIDSSKSTPQTFPRLRPRLALQRNEFKSSLKGQEMNDKLDILLIQMHLLLDNSAFLTPLCSDT